MKIKLCLPLLLIGGVAGPANAGQVLPTGANLDLQAKCASQAKVQFMNDGWADEKMAGYTNHYNDKLNKCFIWITATTVDKNTGLISSSQILEDAFEGKVFGTYTWFADKVKKYGEVQPFECDMIVMNGEKVTCSSADQFEKLASVYME